MAFYDAAFYDSGVHYDEAASPVNPKIKMAKIKLNLQGKTDDELSAYCTNHKTKMAGNLFHREHRARFAGHGEVLAGHGSFSNCTPSATT